MSKVTTWRRLEPGTRQWEMREQLSACVLDPGWLLARQWQLGEFLGQDLGTPIDVSLDVRLMELNRFKPARALDSGVSVLDYDAQKEPLDMLVEREATHPSTFLDPLWMAQAVDVLWANLLAQSSQEMVDAYRTHWLEEIGVLAPSGEDQGYDDARNTMLAVLTSEVEILDGRALYEALDGAFEGGTSLPAGISLLRDPADVTLISDVAWAWVEWIKNHVAQSEEGAWNPETLTHEFSVGARGSGREYVFEGTHHTGKLDWYTFDLKGDKQGFGVTLGGAVSETLHSEHLIPSSVEFPGMPRSRFWEMEDGQFSVAAVEARTTQIARNLWMEFMLVFQDAWWVVPLEMPVAGAVVKVEQMQVTDTFGVTRTVNPIQQTHDAFRLFDIHRADQSGETQFDQVMLRAPVVTEAPASETLERVSLVQDEAANLAWAIEHEVVGRMGQSQARPQGKGEERVPGTQGLSYQLSTSVPKSWYPLVPRPREVLDAEVILERGELLTPLESNVVEPQSELLARPAPYVLESWLIPRQGLELRRQSRVARWLGGEVLGWQGKERRLGGWPGSSGLDFDLTVQGGGVGEEPPETYEDLTGTAYVESYWPWSVWTTLDSQDEVEVFSRRGLAAQIMGDGLEHVPVAMVQGALGCLGFGGTGHVMWGRDVMNLDYVQRYGVFTLVMHLTCDPDSGEVMCCSTTSNDTLPGFNVRYDQAQGSMSFELFDGTTTLVLSSVMDPFAEGGRALVCITGDGQTLSLWCGDRLDAQADLSTWVGSSEMTGDLHLGGCVNGSMRWQGCIGAWGVMPKALDAEAWKTMRQEILGEEERQEKLVWWEGLDPLMSMKEETGFAPAMVDEEVVRLRNKGTVPLDLRVMSGGNGRVTRTEDGVYLAPTREDTVWGLEGVAGKPVPFDEPLELEMVFRPMQRGNHPLVTLYTDVDGVEKEGFYLGTRDRGLEWAWGEEAGVMDWELPSVVGNTQHWRVALAPSGQLDIYLNQSPRPHLSLPACPVLEGVWSTNTGELRLHQRDDVVWGDYGSDGYIQARVNRMTGEVHGYFYDVSTNQFGQLNWWLDGDTWTGVWSWENTTPAIPWNGTRTGYDKPVLTQWNMSLPMFEGSWQLPNTYGTGAFRQAGLRVWGEYREERSALEGYIDPDTGVFTGTYIHHDLGWGGEIQLTMNATNTAFTGLWGKYDQAPYRALNGTLISSNTPPLVRWNAWSTVDEDTLEVLQRNQEESGPVQGVWSTELGEVRLKQRDDVVWGDLADHGTIQARFDLVTGEVVGEFYDTTEERGGNFVWQWNGESWTGVWAWDELTPVDPWNGTLTSTEEPVLTQWPVNPPSFEGSFDSSSASYGKVHLKQAGSRVWGSYLDGSGELEGVLDLDTGVLEGTFFNHNVTQEGRIRFTLTPAGFAGLWATGTAEPNQAWTGVRADMDLPGFTRWPMQYPQDALKSWTRMVVGYSDRESRIPMEGVWSTELGEVRLKQRDDVVWGDLADHGTIQARFDLVTGEVVGEFYDTTEERGGNFVWQWNGESWTGVWAWDELTPVDPWNGTLTSTEEPVLTQWPVNPPSFEGSFDSGPYGTVKFRQAGNRVWGEYFGGAGELEGVLDLDTGVLEGTFYRHDLNIPGRIRFTLTASGFTGLWAKNTTEPYRAWNGTRLDALAPVLGTWESWHGNHFLGEIKKLTKTQNDNILL